MLEKIRLALRISTNAFDAELKQLADAAKKDLGIAGVVNEVLDKADTDAIVAQAIITYCKMHFGQAEDYDRLKKSYDEQKAQLAMFTGYTDWKEG